MVVIFVALTVLALIALDYFVIHPKQQQKNAEISIGELIPLRETMNDIPAGVFLQPTFTWTKIQDDGSLKVGLHPMLLGLVGAPYEIELLQDKEIIEKGDPLLRVNKDGRHLTIKAPVAGEVTAYNQALIGETDWQHLNTSWLYKIQPQTVQQEIPNWQYAEDAGEWLQERYQNMKSFIFEKTAPTSVGITLADGGDIPMGVLSELDEDGWKEFQEKFMH